MIKPRKSRMAIRKCFRDRGGQRGVRCQLRQIRLVLPEVGYLFVQERAKPLNCVDNSREGLTVLQHLGPCRPQFVSKMYGYSFVQASARWSLVGFTRSFFVSS